jgi:DNA invertase Pin-like site-specific DNA recombinase
MVILRAGLYERVSTDEQAKYGYSIKTQIDALEEYCEKNKIKVADHYTDDGVSGGKAAFRRPEMARLLDDIKEKKIDIVLFTRLDRWFRNVQEYFKVQEILDEHKVQWKAIWEDYDTTTANGKMAITIFLAIAQNEREKGAERVRVVFEKKRQNKEAWFGPNSMPFGYTKEADDDGFMRLVKDPALKDAMQDFWDIAVKYHNVSKAAKYVNRVYGLERNKKLWFDVAHNEIYTGDYKGVSEYCEPYVTREEWEMLQNRGSLKKTQGNRVYLFTGLIKCPTCGSSMAATHCNQKRKNGEIKEYRSYRCRHKEIRICDNRHTISELKTEQWLLKNLDELLREEIAKVELERTKPKKKPKTDAQALREKLRRLEVVYMAGNKTDAEYLTETAELKEQIRQAEMEMLDDPAEVDLDTLRATLETDFRGIYETLSPEDKRRFWRGLIKQIHVKGNNVQSVDFL